MTRRPTLAISTGPLWRIPLSEAFAACRAVGAEGVEILVTQDTDTQTPATIERLAERHDLPVVAVHAPLLLLTRRVYSTDPVQKIKRTVEMCKALGVGTIVLHPPYLWQLKYSLWLVHELEDALAGTGCTLTMENMYPIHAGRRRLRFHRYGSIESLSRFGAVTLDTSHLAVAEEDIVAAYRRLADRVVHIHLSDNRGKGRDSHAPIGSGILPMEDFIRTLDHSALRSIALEINPGPEADEPEALERILGTSLETVRGLLPAPRPADP